MRSTARRAAAAGSSAYRAKAAERRRHRRPGPRGRSVEGRRADLAELYRRTRRRARPRPRRPGPRRGAARGVPGAIWAAARGPPTAEAPHEHDHRRLHPAGVHRAHRGRLLRRLRQPAVAPAAPVPPVRHGRAARAGRRPSAPARTGRRRRRGRRARRRALDRSRRRLQPARRPPRSARPGPAGQRGRHPAGRHLLDPAARRPARRRADHVPSVPAVDAGEGDPEGPAGPRGQAVLPDLRRAGRPLPRRPARADRGLLPAVPQPVLVHAEAACRATSSPASTRWSAASRTAASAGSTSPATATSPTAGSCSRACSTPATPTRCAAAIAEQQFLAEVEHPLIVEIYNFVDPRGRRLHRHGVRRRHVAQAAAQGSGCAADGGRYDPLPVDQAIAYVLEILPAFELPARPGPALLRLQARQRHPGRRRGQADRPRRRAPDRRRRLRDLRHGRLPGARGRRRSARRWPPTSTPSAARSRCWRWSSAATRRTYVAVAAAGRRDAAVPAATTRSTGCCAKACAPDPADRFAVGRRAARAAARRAARGGRGQDAGGGRGPALGVVAAVRGPDGHRRARSTGSTCRRCGSTPATRRPPGCATVSVDDPGAAARPLLQPAPQLVRRGAAGHAARAALEAGRTDVVDGRGRATCCGDDPWEWRAVWLSGLAALARGRRRRRAGGVQRRLRAGARRAGAQAGAGAGLRDQRRARRRRVALRDLRAHRRQLHRPGRVRPGPDPRRARATSTARSPPSTWCPRPAGRLRRARRQRAGLLAGIRAVACPPWRRRWAASSP